MNLQSVEWRYNDTNDCVIHQLFVMDYINSSDSLLE